MEILMHFMDKPRDAFGNSLSTVGSHGLLYEKNMHHRVRAGREFEIASGLCGSLIYWNSIRCRSKEF
jgi:hypothetical protein